MNVIPTNSARSVQLPDGATSLGVRPEHIDIVAPGTGHISGTVDVLEYLGADTFIIMSCGNAGQITVRVNGNTTMKPGDLADLAFSTENIHAFDLAGAAVLYR